MSALGRIFTAVYSALEFNTATLSGAIDVVVIEDDSGRRKCTPFHVRFGKLQLLRSRGIPVHIELNGSRTNLKMFLGAAGEAYFYNPSSSNTNRNPTESFGDSSADLTGLGDSSRLNEQSLDDLLSSASPASVITDPTKTKDKLAEIPLDSIRQHLPTRDTSTDVFASLSDSEVELTRNERDGTVAVAEQPRSPPLFQAQRKWSSTFIVGPIQMAGMKSNSHAKLEEEISSATEVRAESDEAPASPKPIDDQDSALFGLPTSPHSQTSEETYEIRNAVPKSNSLSHTQLLEDPLTVSTSISDVVGEEDRKLECRSVDGYEADEDPLELLQERVTSALMRSDAGSSTAERESRSVYRKFSDVGLLDNDVDKRLKRTTDGSSSNLESERGMFSNHMNVQHDVVQMSLCGELLKPGMDEEQIMALFRRHRVTFEEFSKRPELLYDESILFKLDDRLVQFRVAAPFIFSILAFNERLDIDKLADVTTPDKQKDEKEMPDEPSKSPPTPSRRFGRWFFGYSSPPVQGEPLLREEDLDALEVSKDEELELGGNDANQVNVTEVVVRPDEVSQPQTNPVVLNQPEPTLSGHVDEEQGKEQVHETSQGDDTVTVRTLETQEGLPKQSTVLEDAAIEEQALPTSYIGPTEDGMLAFSELNPDSLSLLPTDEQLMELDLKPGPNTVRFIVESTGVDLDCRIFLWGAHSKIVISDVDGTITRSDVLGHVLPAVGRDWSQVGVAGLYSEIEKNGYKLLYLTARPIGQASQTRDFLHGVIQGTSRLPNGPVLMSPNRLMESFTREVIRRNPEVFKIAALRDVRSLFPMDYNPFHAGFGNRETDVISYKAVGLKSQRIFVVNSKGELVVTRARYESTASYSTLQDLVESVFPDISAQDRLERVQALTESANFNDWNYWRRSLPVFDVDTILNEGTLNY